MLVSEAVIERRSVGQHDLSSDLGSTYKWPRIA